MQNILSNNISPYKLEESIEELRKHCKNKNKFKKDGSVLVGGTSRADYSGKSLKRTRASGMVFDQCIFENSAAAGSVFNACIFEKCSINNANFQECSFIQSKFLGDATDKHISNSNFNDSLFTNQFIIKNNYFEHSVFYNTAFIDGRIVDSTFYSCTLEATLFSRVSIENVKFTDLNIDYAVFEDVKMDKVILPFSQICYAFGLLTYLSETKDNIYITSHCNENGLISPNEYLKLIPHFINYYTENREYFPLANIYFYLNKKEEAKEIILRGLLEGVAEIDFRKIKYLCKLIYTYGVFSYHERYDIISYIYSHISFTDMNAGLLYNFTTYKREIEGYLLSNNNRNVVTLEVNIFTNIFPEEQTKLGILLSTMEEIIELYKSPAGEHQINCRHNSAEAFLVLIQDTLPAVIATIGAFYSILVAHYTLQEKRISLQTMKKQKKLELKKMHLEIENERQQLINIQLDNQIKQDQVEQINLRKDHEKNAVKEQILRKNISENDVEISEIKHILFGNIPSNIDEDFIQYTYTNS